MRYDIWGCSFLIPDKHIGVFHNCYKFFTIIDVFKFEIKICLLKGTGTMVIRSFVFIYRDMSR